MTAPRRLQLRRGNSAAISSYTGAAGELVVNTTDWTLYVHDGSTVGGYAATTNTTSITNQISSVNANITVANLGMKGYVDQANTIQSAQISAANLGMKGYVDSVANQSIYSNSNVKSYLTGGFDGNILPSANVTYSLGSLTRQWRDLFVSNNTIYIGGVPLSINTNGQLTVGGNLVTGSGNVANLTNGSATVSLSSGGTLTLPGGARIVPYDTTGAIDLSANVATDSYIGMTYDYRSWIYVDTNGAYIEASNGFVGRTWTFSQSGNLTLPAGGYVLNNNGSIYGGGTNYSNANVASYLPTYSGNISANISKAGYTWIFGTDGTTTFPSNAILTPINNEFSVQSQTTDTDDNHLNLNSKSVDLYAYNSGADSWAELLLTNTTTTSPTANIYVKAQGGTQVNWAFDSTGTLTTPGTVKTNLISSRAANQRVTIDPDGTTLAYVRVDGYDDGGERVVISNQLTGSLGMYFYTETGTFRMYQNQFGFPDNTWQTTAFSNSAIATYLTDSTAKTFGGNVTIEGNLFVNGNVTYISVNNVAIGDNIINLADLNPDNSVDLGITAHRNINSVLQHTGLIRDASANQWKLFSNVTQNVGTTVDFTDAVYDDLQLGNITSPTITAINNNIAAANAAIAFANTIQSQQIAAANVGMKGYVDSLTYSNVQTAAYLTTNNYLTSATANLSLYAWNGNASGGGTSYSNVNVAAYLATGLSSNIVVGTGAYFVGNVFATTTMQYGAGQGGLLFTKLVGGTGAAIYSLNVTPSAQNYALSTNGASLNLNAPTGGGVYTSINNTIVTSLTASYLNVAGNVSAANISAQYFIGDGSRLTTLPGYAYSNVNVKAYTESMGFANYGNANVTAYLPSHTGNVGVNYLLGTTPNVTLTAGSYNSVFDTTGNVILPTAYVTGNVTAGYFIGNGALLTGIAASSNYSNVQVEVFTNLSNYAYNANVTAANLGMKGYVDSVASQSIYGNINVKAYTESMGFTNYSNVNIAAYLSTATINTTGNITAAYISGNISVTGNVTGTSPNVTIQAGSYSSVFDNLGNVTVPQLFTSGNIQTAGYLFGNGAFLTGVVTGGSNYSNVDVANYLPTYTGTVGASLINTSGNVLATGLSVFGNMRIGLAGAVSGQFHSVVGNITQTSSGGAVYFNTTGNVLAAAVVAGALTSTGTVAVNAATGITTNQATFLLANATATTINFGGAATTINMGTVTSNVWVGSAIGNTIKELTLRAQGTWNIATSINSNGGFNSPPYTNQLVIGGSGTGMTANYSATGGYLTTVTIYNPGTGYRSGDVLSVPGGIAGNSFVLTNYSSTRTGTSSAVYTFGIEGNLIVPGNITAARFIGDGSLLTSLPGYAYSNVNVQAYTESMGFQNYGNVNVAALITTNGLTNYSNVNVAAYLNTQGYNLYSNVNVASYLGATQITVANIRLGASGNIVFPDGTVLTTATGGSYSNVQVATYLPTYTGNIANIRLGVSGVLTFPDGTTQITAGGGSYSNVQVATYLPLYGGAVQSSNVQTTTANIQATTAATNTATGALRVMGGVGVAGTVFAGQLNTTGNLIANAISAYSLNTVANVVASVVNAGTINSAGNVLAQNLTGTLTTASQTAITAVGTLATLTVSGNATVGNLVGNEANTRIIANVYTTTFDIYGNVTFPGNVITPTGLYVGPTLFTALPNTIAQFTANANAYAQINFENLSSGTDATADYIATANNGTDTTFFVDLGIANSNYDNASPNNSLGTAVFANDSYLYAQGNLATTVGGNLVIGTSTADKTVKIFAGGINSSNVVVTVASTGANIGGFGVTMPTRPAFRVNGSAGPTQTTSNVNLKSPQTSVVFNQGGYYNDTNGKFTAPVAGIYQVSLVARVNTNGTSQIAVLKNGINSSGNIVCFWEADTSTGTATHFGTSGTVIMAAGDYLSANILLGSISFDGNDNWSVTYLG